MSILSSKGFSLDKRTVSPVDIRILKKKLTACPISHPDYPPIRPFPVYDEGQNWIRLPRAFAFEEFGKAKKNIFSELDNSLDSDKCVFNGSLRESQNIPHNTVLENLLDEEKGHGGILTLMTGSGKTVIANSLISHLKQRTCILVHKSLLLEQWKSELAKFLPTLKVGIIQQKQKDFSTDVDVYIIMIQTLLNIPSVPSIFGFTILDECHHIPSETFSRVLFKVNAKYLLGLSATPERKDGLTSILHWHLGPMIYQEKPDRRNQPTTEVRVLRYINENLSLDPKQYTQMITTLCNFPGRNDYIVSAVSKVIEEDVQRKRCILILTERKQHVLNLYSEISKIDSDCSVLLGGMKKVVIEEAMKKRILIATYNLMSEGNDIPKLNTIVLASPKKDIVQALGRIFRKIHSDIHPIIIDVSDYCLRGQEFQRIKTYRNELNGNIDILYYDKNLRITNTDLRNPTKEKEKNYIKNATEKNTGKKDIKNKIVIVDDEEDGFLKRSKKDSPIINLTRKVKSFLLESESESD